MAIERPRTVYELWAWALNESSSSKASPPWQLHTRAFPPDSHPDEAQTPAEQEKTHDKQKRRLSKRRDQIIGGLPYTRQFTRYLEAAMPKSPIHRALLKMRAHGDNSPQSLEFRVAWAVVVGRYPDVGTLSWVLRAREDLIRGAALRGLGLLYDLWNQERANERDEADRPSTISQTTRRPELAG